MKPIATASGLSNQAAWTLLAVFVLLGAALRLYHLNSGLWFDEIQTLTASVRSPLLEIVTHFPSNNDHLLYSVLAHISISAFGEHAWSLRLPSALFGLAAIPMLYLFALQVTTRLEAVVAASMLAVSYHHIWFSQNARGYSMLLFWTLLGSYLLLKGLRDNRRGTFVAYAVVAALGIYTHLTMAFVVAGHAAVAAWQVLIERPGRFDPRALINPILGFALAGVFTLLLYAPILIEVQTFFEEKTVSTAKRVATPGWALLATLRGLNIGFAMAGGAAIAGVLCLVGFLSYLRQSITISALFVLPAPFILAAAVLLQRPVFPRFFFMLMAFGLLIAVRGVVVIGAWASARLTAGRTVRKRARELPAIFAGGLVVLSALALPRLYTYPKQDYEQALRFLESAVQPGERVVVAGIGAEVPYQKYYGKDWRRVHDAADLSQARADGPVWIVYTFGQYIERQQPDFWAAIRGQCEPVRTFPGTVANADIEVRKCTRI